jgi:hypothetical protein
MSKRVRKLTSDYLKKMIKEEARKLQIETSDPMLAGIDDIEKVEAEETEASDLADSLEKDIDYLKVLKIHESKLVSNLKRLRSAKTRLRKRITKSI